MKRRTLLELWKVFERLAGLKHDVRFSYFLAKNKVVLKTELEILDEAYKPNELYISYEQKRVEAAQKLADKDDSNQPKINNGSYVININRDEFQKEIKKLKIKFKKAIDEREKQIGDYEKLLDEDVNIDLTKIRFSQLPEQIESAYMEVFIEADLVEDDQ